MLQQKPAGPRVVLHLSGKGVCASTPLRIKGVQHLILYADPKEPLLLDINPANIAYPAAAIEMSGGRLELIGVRLRVNPATPMPAMIHMQDGDVTLTRCTLLGPLYKPTDSFQTLIFMSNSAAPPTTLLMRDNVLLSAKRLIHLQDHVELRARNNLGVSLGSAMVFDATRPTADVTHVLDHNTIAARNNVFWLRTGPGFYPARQVRMHASSNAFLTPFLEGSDQRVLVRGADSWNRSGRWSWQGRYNVYDNRLHAFFVTGAKGAAPKQTLRDWQNVWGQVGEFEAHPLDVGALAKALQADSPAIANLPTLLDRLALPRSIRGDPDQSPPGADLWSLGIAKKKN
jgi:hypothetical protein